MKRLVLLACVLLLSGCAHDAKKAPCTHPTLALFASGCGPLVPLNR